MWQKLQNVDRRVIYVLMMVVCVYALLNPMGLPISINSTTQMAYDKIQALQPGDIVWLGYEFSAGGVPELVPAIKATAKMAFEKGARIVSGTMWLEGQNLGGAALREMADLQGKVYGVDYVQIGYKPGGQVFLERAVDDLWDAAVGIDENGTDLAMLPLMEEVKSMAAFDLIFIYCTGNPAHHFTIDHFRFAFFLVIFILAAIAFHFTLGQAFVDALAHQANDEVDRLGGVVVGRNGKVDQGGVDIGIHDGEGGDIQLAGFVHGDMLLHCINDEQGCRKLAEVGDATQSLIELGTLAADLQAFALRHIGPSRAGHVALDPG